MPPDRGRKRDETESDQPLAARRRLVSKRREKRDDEAESDQPPCGTEAFGL